MALRAKVWSNARVMASSAYAVALTRHPDTSCRAVRSIEAQVSWTQSETLAITYTLEADLVCLRLPPPQQTRRADRLWEHTCFEAFIAGKNKQEYYEFNFAPSGEWAVYAFRSYRERVPLEDEQLDPEGTVRKRGNRFELDVGICLGRLPKLDMQSRLRVGLSAVIEDNDGRFSYWALKHPPGKPDFHHADNFALEIETGLQTVNESVIDKR
jgi:hypothetical protein